MECVTCGAAVPAERVELGYGYCTAPRCVQENLKPLTIVEAAVNKSAPQFLILDDETKEKLRNGSLKDQRRFLGRADVPRSPANLAKPTGPVDQRAEPSERVLPGDLRQQRLVRVYRAQGLRPQDIAEKVGMSRYDVTQVLLDQAATRRSQQ